MKIETKFNLGDKVFVLFRDRIQEVEVTGIHFFDEVDSNRGINYKIKFAAGGETTISESRLFATKDELIKTL